MSDEPLIRNVSDTALWVAMYRALESERPDALFHDPYAAQLAGERGRQILQTLPNTRHSSWPMVVRTQVLDELIQDAVEQDGFDTVLNLACGLDTRPYRLALPAALRWVEADLPGMIEYKSAALKNARAFCRLERHAMDLTNDEQRHALFTRVGAAANRVLVITEGLLIYLHESQVKSLAADLHQHLSMKRWLTDLCSPRLLKMLAHHHGKLFATEDTQFRFAPRAHAEFFRPLGWTPAAFLSMAVEARRLNRFEVPAPLVALGTLTGLLIPGMRTKMRRLGGILVLERA
jgi:methyltransferase (TIGR00027 family)